MVTHALTESDIAEFRAIWREEYGDEIAVEEAQAAAANFLAGIHLMLTLADRGDAKNGSSAEVVLDDFKSK